MDARLDRRDDPRDRWQAVMDVKYAVAAHALSERAFGRANAGIVFLQVLLTSGAVGAIAKQSFDWSLAIGMLLACASAIQQAFKPLSTAGKHAVAKERFSRLLAKSGPMGLDKLESELASAGAAVPLIPRAIQIVAFNDNVLANGRPDGMQEESFWVRIVRAVA